MTKAQPIIIVDVHERNAGLLEAIQSRGLDAEEGALPSGDVSIQDSKKSVGVELKRGSDFTHSLYDNRLSNQICVMDDNFDFSILIVEAWKPWVTDDDNDHSISEKVRKTEKAIRTLNREITLQETKDMNDTVNYISDIVRDFISGKLFFKKRPIIIESEMTRPMRFICGLPNVKQVIGERILDTYGCAKHALDAVDKWEEIDGIGKVKLAKIKDTLMEGEYK